MMDRLVVGNTLRNWAFVATTLHMNLIYDITLVALVPQSVYFLRQLGGLSGVGRPVELRELAVLPVVHPENKAHYIGLLFPP